MNKLRYCSLILSPYDKFIKEDDNNQGRLKCWSHLCYVMLYTHFLYLNVDKCVNMPFFFSWHNIRTSLHNCVKMLLKRFRLGLLLAGFVALTMAAVSWKLETYQSYWIWHR